MVKSGFFKKSHYPFTHSPQKMALLLHQLAIPGGRISLFSEQDYLINNATNIYVTGRCVTSVYFAPSPKI